MMVRMDITPYIESLRRDLLAAADAAGPETRAAAERLAYALDPSVRLALMEAISQAAAEISAELPAGSVDVRLAGRDLSFVVESPAPAPPPPPPPPAPDAPEGEDVSVVRITVRLPESVKARAEELAAKSGQSLNTWLVNAIRRATHEPGINVDIDLSNVPFLGEGFPGGGRGGRGRRMTGWV